MTSAIRFENISKKFTLQSTSQKSFQESVINFFRRSWRTQPPEEIWTLKNLSFDIQQGCTTGIIGPNGAGKSTILKLITGIIKPTEGKITLNGSVAAMLELGTGFHPDLTGRENLYLYGAMFGLSQQDIERKIPEIIEFSELDRFIDVPIKNYSSGMHLRLGFAAAIQVDTNILLLDEVLAVGDFAFQEKCVKKFKDFQAAGKTIVLVSHDLLMIQALCDQALLIEGNHLTASGDVGNVVEAYYHNVSLRKNLELPKGIDAQKDKPIPSTAKIIGVELLNERGEHVEVVEDQQPVRVRVKYEADPGIKDAQFGVQIWGETHEHVGNEVVCHDTNTVRHEILPLELKRESSFEVEYPAMPLSTGHYFIRVAIFPSEPGRDPYATSFRVCSFEVKRNNKGGTGLVSIPHHWKIN